MEKVSPAPFLVYGLFLLVCPPQGEAAVVLLTVADEILMKGGESRMKDVIAYRKSCAADGTGLSHYILVAEAK
jgi:modified peptide precursor CbpA